MTKAQMAKSLAKTQATIEQVAYETATRQEAERQRIIAENCEAARERRKERDLKKIYDRLNREWDAEREKAQKKAVLEEEWRLLSDRYDRLFEEVCKFSDAAIRQFEQDAGTKAILNRIKAIDAEYAAIG